MFMILFVFCDLIAIVGTIILLLILRKRAKKKIKDALNELYCIKDMENCSLTKDTNVVIIEKNIKPLKYYIKKKFILDETKALLNDVHVQFITVELQNKERLCFAIESKEMYNSLYRGDVGTLTHNGNYFVNFERN